MITFAALQQWITFGQWAFSAGSKAWEAIRAAAKANGYDGDTSELDKVIADADRRKGIAQSEAG